MKIKQKEVLFLLALAIIVASILYLVGHNVRIQISILGFLLSFIISISLFELFRRMRDKNEKDIFANYQSIEGLLSIYHQINFRHPIKPMRDWAISPDVMSFMIKTIKEKKPNCIVECGSGVSTVLNAYMLEENQTGKIISLDHDEFYAGQTQQELRNHNLTKYAEVVYAPLTTVSHDEKTYKMYNHSLNEKIDILLVDGPPKIKGENSRYPVLLHFYENLADKSIVVMDDAAREDIKAIVQDWQVKYPQIVKHEFLNTEKGTSILYIEK